MSAKKSSLYLTAILAVLALLLMSNLFIRMHIDGFFEGFYLLKDKKTGRLELTDHLFVGREKQLIYGLDIRNSSRKIAKRLFPKYGDKHSHLYCEWNPRDGSGLVSSSFADGTGLVTYLGRYLDDDEEVHGLFIGGGLPETVESNMNYNMNNSGMTYFDGARWYHIWCSVNEGIGSAVTGANYTPSKW